MTAQSAWWEQGDECPSCGYSFCVDHRPGFEDGDIVPTQHTLDGLRFHEPLPGLHSCWSLTHFAAAKANLDRGPNADTALVRQLGEEMAGWVSRYVHPTDQRARSAVFQRINAVVPIPSARRPQGTDSIGGIPGVLGERIALARACSFIPGGLSLRPGAPSARFTMPSSRADRIQAKYEARFDFDGVTVLVVDDIVQTQSTLADAARALLDAGAAEVVGFAAVAMAADDDRWRQKYG